MSRFEVGKCYRVKKSFTALRDKFETGELLTYKESAYSRYDGITGHIFRDETPSTRVWDIYDGDTPDFGDLFEEVR
ncbi:hypothetical protein CMV30_06125 [Nibricoccus aquaticus]|uniref:DUF3601 domain-containing protein n=1 Tax=Nibricoccus aquaticus TaxID=2576891 RepID=A0A290Q4Z8_9BACT|nr:hypothetical protein [Nibricoccus aquaticus]ATC63564.1 hypothetical protein CMV30_06125 [Nibricoccus aquaticus]